MHVNRINNIFYNQFNPVFRGEFEDRVQNMRSNYNALSWWWSGEDEAKEIVAKNMRSEINELEINVAKKQVERDGSLQALNDLKRHHSSVISSMQSTISTLQKQTSNNASTIEHLESSLSGLGSTLSSLIASNNAYRDTISKQEATQQEIQNKTNKIIEAHKEQELKIKEDFNKKLKNLEISQKLKLQELEKQQDLSIKMLNQMEHEINNPQPEGFGAIAGYKEEKNEIKNTFGKSVVLERYGKTSGCVPNGILLFGPDGDFNNEFVYRISKQYKLNLKELDYIEDEVTRLKNLRALAKNAGEEFKKTGIRTLIFIRDFDTFAPKNTQIIGPMKSFMDKVSSDHHATVVATTTKPNLLDDILLRTTRFQLKLGIPPINETNLIALIKANLDVESLINMDIKSLATKILSMQTSGFYSVQALKTIIKNIVPSIDNNAVKAFKEQVKILKHM